MRPIRLHFYDRCSGIADQGNGGAVLKFLQDLRAHLVAVVIMIGAKLCCDPIALQQTATDSGVFAVHQIGGGQGGQSTDRNVAQIANGLTSIEGRPNSPATGRFSLSPF